MKLKTLNDMGQIISAFQLKEEAIKWVKYYDKESNWELLFKKFQNITEEDLKEQGK